MLEPVKPMLASPPKGERLATLRGEVAAAWLAGIFEGEGHVRARRGPKGTQQYAQLVIGMTDRDVMERVAFLLDAPLYERPRADGNKTIYRVEINGHAKVEAIFRRIRKFLGERRLAQFEQALGASVPRPTRVLTADQVRAIRTVPTTRGCQPALAAQYGVSVSTIASIRQGRTWKEVV